MSSVEAKERLKRVESILVTQMTTKNNKAPYDRLVEKYGIKVDYRPFTEVRPVSAKEFRKQKVKLEEYSAIIFTSKSAIDHYFRLCEEMRYKVPAETKYFCLSEAIALYLQKHTTYRKRRVFFGKRTLQDLKPYLLKHKKKETFLLPSSNLGKKAYETFLEAEGFNFVVSEMYLAASSDISDLEDVFYDILVFFSPLSLDSLYDNFPDFKQNNTRIAVYGNSTAKAIEAKGLYIDIKVPNPEFPKIRSMAEAIEHYIKEANDL
ncbi:uroporphyrinogen-III synthase [Saprospira grandis]|uniref:Uroporphyrinogen-III synthase n=1 Tax=Saprospira grandis (strain Lewin) TaxID=984262 RepID=H6LAC9_SAPGL|nr:uroporphyrinogen-III synthase [Saprospira grandis]AFC24414.1 uroporphyrinogen-III synthase [Saprospira grandis str. Lewin]